MLLSIVIPIYNAEDYIKTCVESIFQQLKDNVELILVNDGSTDNSLSICYELSQEDSRVQIITQNNKGPIEARKRGVEFARGDYIMFVDADDMIADTAIEFITSCLDEFQTLDIIQFNYCLINSKGEKKENVISPFDPGIYTRDRLKKSIFPKLIYFDGFFRFGVAPSLCNKVFKRELVNQFIFKVPEDVFFGEDGLVTYQCFINANKILFAEDVIYFYRENDDSICRSRSYIRNKLKQNNILFRSYENNEAFKQEVFQGQIANYAIYMTWIGIKEQLMRKMYYDGNITLRSIKKTVQIDIHKYFKNQKWRNVPRKTRLILFCVSHLMIHLLFMYLKITIRRTHNGTN